MKANAFWVRLLHQAHWVSAAVSLMAMLLFAVTGITLNHAADIPSRTTITTKEARLPSNLLSTLQHEAGTPAVTEWFKQQLQLRPNWQLAEWEDDEVYLDLPCPGGDAWLTIQRDTGDVFYESTSRGWIAWLNDLHKGRNTGEAWRWFIDIFAVACLVFSITGLVLLHLYSKNRPSTWPLVATGTVLPVLLLILFVHT